MRASIAGSSLRTATAKQLASEALTQNSLEWRGTAQRNKDR
jgi:hypothetical protein